MNVTLDAPYFSPVSPEWRDHESVEKTDIAGMLRGLENDTAKGDEKLGGVCGGKEEGENGHQEGGGQGDGGMDVCS